MSLTFALAALATCTVADAPIDGAGWRSVGGDPGGSRYSPWRQINTTNVSGLKLAWTYHTRDASDGTPIQCTPLVAEGTMYLVTSGHRVVALDPATGKPKWTFDSRNDGARSGHSRSSRGVAYWSDGSPAGKRRILYGTPDGRVLSIDARSGKPDVRFKAIDLRSELGTKWHNSYVGVSAAPTVFGDLVYVGIASGEDVGSAPGTIMAFSVLTGEQRWKFEVLPRKNEFGSETWPNRSSDASGSAGAWSGYALDPKSGILFAATGSAAPDFDGSGRIGNNLFANCVLALNARTGKRLWHFQTVHHDLWDHDNASPPILCKVKRGGKSIDAVSVVTKTGFCFVFDRSSGRPLFDVREVPAAPSSLPGEIAALTQPEPVLPPPLTETVFTKSGVTNISSQSRAFVLKRIEGLKYGLKYMPPTRQGTVVSPGYFGGSPWSGASFDPRSNTLFVNTNNLPSIMSNPANYAFLTDHEGYPGVRPPWGILTAIDLKTGKFRWRRPLGECKELTRKGVPQTGTPNFGGTLVTAGNLGFAGATFGQTLRAFDNRTGKILME